MEYLRSSRNNLTQAIARRDWPAVRIICGTEPHLTNTENEVGVTPLWRAAYNDAPEDVMLMLIEKTTTEALEHEDTLFPGQSILHRLAERAYAAAVRRVLNRTTRHITKGDGFLGRTPLHYCLEASEYSYDAQRETALVLVSYGASSSIKDNKGKTPLDLYDDNECSKYEDNTRTEKKKELRELLEELSVPAEIIARGEEAINAFKDAIQSGYITVVNSRFMFLGKEGAGKTSCVNTMLGKAFNAHQPSTDGIVTTTVFQTVGEDCKWEEHNDVDECELTKQIRDQAIAANIAKKLKQPESQQNITKSASLSSMVELPEAVMHMTLQRGSKGQLHESRGTGAVSMNPTLSRANRFEKKLPEGIHKMLVDKLTDESPGPGNIGPSDVTCIWDYAGQLTYYITHRFFLTDGSSYGVVFSLLDDLDALAKPRDSQKGPFEMTNLQMHVFWIRSIYEYAVLPYKTKKRHLINNKIASPPISLIGTHMDQLSGSEEEKQKKIKGIFNRIFDEIKGKPYENNVDLEMYVVDNTAASDKGIEKLKKNVGGYMKAMAKTVPIKWVDFQTKLQEVGKTRVRMSLDEISKIAVECGISNENAIHVLNYLNDLGIILYSPTNKKLKNTVITNIHMLIGIFMKIITVVKPDDPDKAVPVMMKYWRKLDEEGILAEQLLHYLWRDELTTGKDDNVFEVFLEIMKTFGLLFEKGSQGGSRVFIVPSRMSLKIGNLEVKKDEEQTVSIYVTPKDFLPDAVYSVLVVKFLDLSQDKACSGDPELFQNQAEIGFDNMHYLTLGVVCINNKRSLKLEITRKTEIDEYGKKKPAFKPQAIACMEILHVLKLHLDGLYPSKDGYTVNILCPVCTAGSNQRKLHFSSLDDCLKDDTITCGTTTVMSTAGIQSLFQADLSFSKEIRNFHTLQSLVTELGTEQMRMYFMKKCQLRNKHDVGNFLLRQRQKGFIKDADFGDQAKKIFTADADINTFDITILMSLIQHCFSPKGDTFWHNPPDENDASELANLRRIQLYKETILDCSHSNSVTDEEFDKQWKKLTAIFGGVGVPVEGIQKYRKQCVQGSVRGFEQENIEEIKNFQAVLSVIVDVGTVTMREYLLEVTKLDKKDVGNYLLNEKKKGSFKNVNITKEQRPKMFTPAADIETFDISIMYLIIRNCCCTIPVSFWKNPDRLTNLIHIHHYRNTKLAHSPNSRMSTKDFEIEWKKVRSMLHAAGASFNDIDKYKALRFMN